MSDYESVKPPQEDEARAPTRSWGFKAGALLVGAVLVAGLGAASHATSSAQGSEVQTLQEHIHTLTGEVGRLARLQAGRVSAHRQAGRVRRMAIDPVTGFELPEEEEEEEPAPTPAPTPSSPDTACEQEDKEITYLNGQLAEKTQTIGELEKQIAEREKELKKEIAAQLAEKTQTIGELEKEIAELKQAPSPAPTPSTPEPTPASAPTKTAPAPAPTKTAQLKCYDESLVGRYESQKESIERQISHFSSKDKNTAQRLKDQLAKLEKNPVTGIVTCDATKEYQCYEKDKVAPQSCSMSTAKPCSKTHECKALKPAGRKCDENAQCQSKVCGQQRPSWNGQNMGWTFCCPDGTKHNYRNEDNLKCGKLTNMYEIYDCPAGVTCIK